jgi:hypothetical protein
MHVEHIEPKTKLKYSLDKDQIDPPPLPSSFESLFLVIKN